MKLTLSLNVKHVYEYRVVMKVNQISTILYGPSPAKYIHRDYFLIYWSPCGNSVVALWTVRGPGSSVRIATDYGLDGPGIKSQWG
jgi:hypothetical protein